MAQTVQRSQSAKSGKGTRTSQKALLPPVPAALNRRGMSPDRLLAVAKKISPAILEKMEQAIEQGCGQVDDGQ